MKILLASAKFHDYEISIADVLNNFGHETIPVFWHDEFRNAGLFPFIGYLLQCLFLGGKKKYYYFHRKKLNDSILSIISKIKPHIFLIIKGDIFIEWTLNKIKKISPQTMIVTWLWDPCRIIENFDQNILQYDYIFVYDPDDVEFIKNKYQIATHYLPIAFDTKHYKILPNSKLIYDVFFCGNIRSKKRLEILGCLLKTGNTNTWKMEIGGSLFRPWQIFKRLKIIKNYPLLYRSFKNRNYEHNELNNLYNISKISLNIHYSDDIQGLSIRSFEIAGAGGLQLVDDKKAIHGCFKPDNEIITFSDVNNLIIKINDILNNYSKYEKIRKNAHNRACLEHTFENRINHILAIASSGCRNT